MLRSAKLVKISCIFTKKHLWSVVYKLQDLGIVHLEKAKPIDNFKPVEVKDRNCYYLQELLKSANSLVALIESRSLKPFLIKIFGQRRIYLFQRKDIGFDEIKKDLKKLEKKYAKLKYKKQMINLSDYSYVLFLRDSVKDKLERYSALENFTESDYLARFVGWIKPEDANRLTSAIEFVTKKACVFTICKPKYFDMVPTLLNNPFFIKPFEIFVENYEVPEYRDINPTPIIALTFTLIFGLMFADLGYGISLTALSLFVYFYTTKESAFRRNLNIILIYLGISSALFGFFLGEFFGISFRNWATSPIDDILLFLKISIVVGLVHMSTGILAKMFSSIKNMKNVLQCISLLVIIWSAFSLFINTNLLISKILLFVGIFVLAAVQRFEALKELMSLAVASLSYMRIAIIGFGHFIINRLIVSSYPSMSGSILGSILFIAVFIIGFAIVLTLGIFVTIVQDVRLHWIEFFPKFIAGRGIRFNAFKHKEI